METLEISILHIIELIIENKGNLPNKEDEEKDPFYDSDDD